MSSWATGLATPTSQEKILLPQVLSSHHDSGSHAQGPPVSPDEAIPARLQGSSLYSSEQLMVSRWGRARSRRLVGQELRGLPHGHTLNLCQHPLCFSSSSYAFIWALGSWTMSPACLFLPPWAPSPGSIFIWLLQSFPPSSSPCKAHLLSESCCGEGGQGQLPSTWFCCERGALHWLK